MSLHLNTYICIHAFVYCLVMMDLGDFIHDIQTCFPVAIDTMYFFFLSF